MFSVVLVCLAVCASFYMHHWSKSYEQIDMKFYGGVRGGNRKNCFNFGGDLGLFR